MAEVKVLIEGYTTDHIVDNATNELTCATVTLVKSKNITMVVDPGTMKYQNMLTEKLKEEGLTKDDINVVCITHSHIDHYRNAGMFPRARALDYWGIWEGDTVKDWKRKFADDIEILKTPGHNYDGITLLVKTYNGVVAICGDVFWKENFPKDDPYASDKIKLKESREKILEIADWIIPGHSGMYKVKK